MSDARVTGLGGVFFKAHDPRALGEWYRRHLGLPVEQGAFAVFRWRERDADAPGSTVWAVFDEASEYFGASGQRAMLNYRVADLDAVHADLRHEGVAVDERKASSPPGADCAAHQAAGPRGPTAGDGLARKYPAMEQLYPEVEPRERAMLDAGRQPRLLGSVREYARKASPDLPRRT